MEFVEERRRPVRRLTPPRLHRPDPWAPKAAARPEFFIASNAAQEIRKAAETAAQGGNETLGLLVGDRFADAKSGKPFAVVLACATAPLRSTATHVRFDPDEFDSLARSLNSLPFDYLLVGWYHSHLGYGCFLSETDRMTQARFFRQPHQVALVIDPVRKEARAFRLIKEQEREAGFALFDAGAPWADTYRTPK